MQIKIKLTNEKRNFMIQINDTEGTDVVFYKACYCFTRSITTIGICVNKKPFELLALLKIP